MKKLTLISIAALSAALVGCGAGGSSNSGGSSPEISNVGTSDGSAGSDNSIGDSTRDPDGEPGGFDPSGAYTKDCFWGPSTDANAVNVLYPDKFAIYWVTSFNIPAGGEVILKGQYPLARYMSFNAYDPIVRPIDAVADAEILPDEGSVNTSLEGADRFADDRSYTLRIIAAVPPENLEDREANTLYSFQGQGDARAPSNQALVIYRVYIPDEGGDKTGGVGLPRVVLKQANGSEVSGSEGCEAAEQFDVPPAAADALAASDPAPVGGNTAVFDPPQWLKFFNLQSSQMNRFNATPAGDVIRPTALNPQNAGGGFASNIHNAYIYAVGKANAITNKEIMVFAAKFPKTPTTLQGDAVMGGGDMRYWSVCSNDRDSQRFIDCIYDEITVPMSNADGTLIDNDPEQWRLFVVAPGGKIPNNATEDNGVNLLAWGVAADTLIIMRNMLSENDFQGAVQFVPGAAGSCEASSMQQQFPYVATMSQADFEDFGDTITYSKLTEHLKASQFSQDADNSNCKTNVNYGTEANPQFYEEPTRPNAIVEPDTFGGAMGL